MTEQIVYVPVLKAREGEFAALEALDQMARTQIMPLVDIPAVPHDFIHDRPAKTLQDHIAGIPARLNRCRGKMPFYLDMSFLDSRNASTGTNGTLASFFSECAHLELAIVPVVSRSSAKEYLSAVREGLRLAAGQVCIRLLENDFAEELDIDTEIDHIMGELGLSSASFADLIIDLKDISKETSRATLIARSVLSMVPRREEWRRLILACSSFPEDLSDVSAATTVSLKRVEWDLWNALQRKPAALPRRDMVFGDYSISNPLTKELDPRTMRMSANIRYTTPGGWLIVKGRNVRQYGFEQYFDLSEALIAREEYCGPRFSWGDKYISDCAEHMEGPGNATTWRKVGTNHHIKLVLSDLSKLHPVS